MCLNFGKLFFKSLKNSVTIIWENNCCQIIDRNGTMFLFLKIYAFPWELATLRTNVKNQMIWWEWEKINLRYLLLSTRVIKDNSTDDGKCAVLRIMTYHKRLRDLESGTFTSASNYNLQTQISHFVSFGRIALLLLTQLKINLLCWNGSVCNFPSSIFGPPLLFSILQYLIRYEDHFEKLFNRSQRGKLEKS